MGKHGPRLPASVLLSFMALLQAQTTSASPVRRVLQNRAETAPTNDHSPGQRYPPPTLSNVEAIDYSVIHSPDDPDASRDWQSSDAIAWEIGDGQVQAYSVLTVDVPVTNDGVVALSRTASTSTDTYTRLPRAWTAPSGSVWPDRSSGTGRASGQGHPTDGPHPDGPSGAGHFDSSWDSTPDDGNAPDPMIPGAQGSGKSLSSAESSTALASSLPTPINEGQTSIPPTPSTPFSTADAASTTSAAFSLTTTSIGPSMPVGPSVSSVPDSLLTSLSTSEVQTVTDTPSSSISGVTLPALI